MFLGLIGLAVAFDNLWLLMMLVPFALVIRYGVVAREEAYLERKFGDVYRGYRSRVRRWRPLRNAAPMVSRLRRPRLPSPFVGFFDGAVQPHLDQMQHAPINDPTRHRL